jgi:hypothetical protein
MSYYNGVAQDARVWRAADRAGHILYLRILGRLHHDLRQAQTGAGEPKFIVLKLVE